MADTPTIDPASFYVVWTGSIHLGDTPGVFMDAEFVGLMLLLPVTITFLDDNAPDVQFLLTTTEVEIFDGKRHPCYWDWTPGSALAVAVGHIDDRDIVPGKPELHLLTVPRAQAGVGRHTLAILVNADIPAGLRDDFVLKRFHAHDSVGARLGW